MLVHLGDGWKHRDRWERVSVLFDDGSFQFSSETAVAIEVKKMGAKFEIVMEGSFSFD